jgi:hypothetical protein
VKYYVQQLEWLPRGSIIECRYVSNPKYVHLRYIKAGDGANGRWFIYEDSWCRMFNHRSKRLIVSFMNQAARVLVYRPHQIDIEEYAKRKRGGK